MDASSYVNLQTPDEVEAVMAKEAGPAVIDFWAPWCGPCKVMAPHFEAVAQARAGGPTKFYKIDTEAHPELGQAFHVRSIPTILFIHGGEILDGSVGALDAERLSKKVEWLESKARGEGFWSRLFKRSPAQD